MSAVEGTGTRRGPGELLYRWRGLLPVIPIACVLVFARWRPAGAAVGLVLILAGEGVRLWAAAHLGRTARSRRPRAEKLVSTGPYARTRHPLYWGNLCLVAGFAVAGGAGWPWFPALAAGAYLLLYRGHARREEAALAAGQGARWTAYRAAVPAWRWRLRPVRVPAAGKETGPSWRRALSVEALTLNAEFWLLAALAVRFRLAGGG